VPLGLAALAGLFLFYRERNKRKKMEHKLPAEKNPSFTASDYNNTQPQNAYGQVAMNGDNGMNMSDRPVTKMYEMDTRREAELPAGFQQPAGNSGAVAGYDYNVQHIHEGDI
jgi:hypothetical protein